jgi:hypothetical protein
VTEELTDRFNPRRVTVELGQIALTRPAPVAVHDDRNVTREVVQGEERCLPSRCGQTVDYPMGRYVRPGWRIGGPGQGCARH